MLLKRKTVGVDDLLNLCELESRKMLERAIALWQEAGNPVDAKGYWLHFKAPKDKKAYEIFWAGMPNSVRRIPHFEVSFRYLVDKGIPEVLVEHFKDNLKGIANLDPSSDKKYIPMKVNEKFSVADVDKLVESALNLAGSI